jgi:hypothetical protein
LASEETSRTLAESTPNIVLREFAEPTKPLACLLFRLLALPASGKTLPIFPPAPKIGSVTDRAVKGCQQATSAVLWGLLPVP